jgi:hypothetical protein
MAGKFVAASAVLIGMIACPGSAMAQDSGYSALTVEVVNLHGEDGIPAGQSGRFEIIIRNGGPDASTATIVSLAWFRSPLFGHTIGYDFSAYPSQGSCSRSITPEPDCRLGTIPVGGEVRIDFHGATEPGVLGWYVLRVWAGSDQAATTLLAEFSKGTSVTVFESGGGVTGILGLLALLCVGAARHMRKRRQGDSIRPPLSG